MTASHRDHRRRQRPAIRGPPITTGQRIGRGERRSGAGKCWSTSLLFLETSALASSIFRQRTICPLLTPHRRQNRTDPASDNRRATHSDRLNSSTFCVCAFAEKFGRAFDKPLADLGLREEAGPARTRQTGLIFSVRLVSESGFQRRLQLGIAGEGRKLPGLSCGFHSLACCLQRPTAAVVLP